MTNQNMDLSASLCLLFTVILFFTFLEVFAKDFSAHIFLI